MPWIMGIGHGGPGALDICVGIFVFLQFLFVFVFSPAFVRNVQMRCCSSDLELLLCHVIQSC